MRKKSKVPRIHHLLINQRNVKPPPDDLDVKSLRPDEMLDPLFSYDLAKSVTKFLVAEISASDIGVRAEYGERYRWHARGGPDYHAPTLILSILAPHLKTLTCISTHTLYKAIELSLGAICFPLLTELTLHNTQGRICPIYCRNHSSVSDGIMSFPSLKYLHCISSSFNVNHIPYRVPALTHLQVTSGATPSLKPLFQTTTNQSSKSPDEHPAPQLRRIMILPGRHYPRDLQKWLHRSVPEELRTMVEIQETAHNAQSGKPKAPQKSVSQIYGYAEAERDWLKGVEGVGPYWPLSDTSGANESR
ncbi:hypothetical protein NLI96_g10854 [Meripilus lineatus]|uniref:Uncharacterized protein n=1 Tax=Meripilus lineatus TaxID=2056292 RepID=A0AAD5UUC0_9APHY|nr:hypothetical protein NLI96_g10854 [Physisporinus lineatus]